MHVVSAPNRAHSKKGNNMLIDLPQPPPPKTEPRKSSRGRPLTGYYIFFFACCAAFVLLAFFAMRGADGSFDPGNLIARMNAMPRWAHGFLTVVMLAFLALEFDVIGRLIASIFVRLVYGRNTTRHRLAFVRLVVQVLLLVLLAVGPYVTTGLLPTPDGVFPLAVIAAMAVPTAFSAVEWHKTKRC